MLRLFYSNSMPVCRIPIYTQHFRTLKSTDNVCFVRKSEKCAHYSTLQSHKVLDPILSRKRKQIKLKAKPYEELLKVLEAREHALESSDKSIPSEKQNLHVVNPKASAIKSDPSVDRDIYNEEGIYTVKNTAKIKKKSLPKNQVTSIEEKRKEPPTTKKPKVKLSEKQTDFKRTLNHAFALRALKSYIEVSVNAEEVEKAQHFLRMRLEKIKRKYKLENKENVDLYNVLISGWAQKSKLDKIKQLFHIMEKTNVTPNLQSYAGYFECLSRGKFLDVTEIQLVVDDMKSKGFSHKDILQKCIFIGDQKEKVIEALGYVDGDLSLPQSSRIPAYSCKLLQKLNDISNERERHPDFCFKEEDISTLAISQLQLENRFSQRIKSVAAINTSKELLKSRKYLEECEGLWRKKLTMVINNFKSFEKKFHERSFCKEEATYPYLAVIDTEILVNLLLQEIRLLAETGEFFSPQEKVLYKALGMKVMNHYFIWLSKKNEITNKVHLIYQKYLSYLLDSDLLSKYSPREYWEYLKTVNTSGPTIDLANVPWPYSVLVKIGCELYDILQRNIAFNPNLVHHKTPSKVVAQAFYVTYEDGPDVKISKHIRTHPLLCKLYRDAQLEHLEFDATLLPMLSPPKPWVKHDSGGLLITTIPFIRSNDHAALHQSNRYSSVPSQQLHPCFDSLNSLSLCPWIINKPLLDVIIDVFQKGGNEKLDIPLNPNSFPAPPSISSTMTKQEKAVIWKHKKEVKKKKCETASLWYDCLYKLSIANHFRDKVFWFPHNLDFRGRVYPTPPHFNHLGSDMARSILLFAEGQPLGKRGLDWLKLQLINLTGFKKRDSHAVRLKFADEMIPEFLDSADRPFEGNQWWRTSDKPWQTLACCKELANAIRHPKPEEYVSHFPIHQDGSCNGLQHYAALGRDELGAIEVNLHPSDAPQDVYSGVSALVEKERQNDAANNVEVAKVLEGFVNRKVVKQTVMTFVYGVTRYGAKLQILKQLKDMPEFPEKYQHEAAIYLMKKIFLSIKEMFTATQEIQDWFTDCAEHITRVSGDTLEWVTPLELPVIQPYHKEIKIRMPKYLFCQGSKTNLDYSSYNEPYQSPNIRKQKNGFAPNFIHSLDATHMMLTSLYCQRKGITFVSVHDCYWTHASSVEIMNKVCREQFVSLHSEPILEDLSKFFLDKYARVVDENIQGNKSREKSARLKLRDLLSTIPKKGVFDLNKVFESEYFFS